MNLSAQSARCAPTRLVVVARSQSRRPRTYRLVPQPPPAADRSAAYRRLAIAILQLDVATLAAKLSSKPRLDDVQ
jgi:hypothetical protein